MIPDHVVDEVRARADLVAVVGESVELKRSGKEWKGRCPFHDDRTPSFYVVPDKGFYKCFGCGESGDVFTFLMKRTGMEFLDTVKHLGQRFGVEVREVTKGEGEHEDPLRPHYEANAFARAWFQEQIADPEVGAPAREYLEARGIDQSTRERFGLGYAPDEWRGLRDAARKHEIPEDLLLEIGLLTTSQRAADPYDRFRNRIIFPIESVRGRVVAFGGRVPGPVEKGVPKYLNSPESEAYHKGDVLYALGWNRNVIRREGAALLVEGYMDVVALGAYGIEHAVATLGTALTENHARLLTRYTRRVFILFDSDEAGLRATFRAADVLLAHGIHPSVVTFPPGEDPDSVVRAEGSDALNHHLDHAVDILDRKLQLLDERGYFESVDRKREAVDKLLPTLRATRDPALRDIYVARVAERTGVRRGTLDQEIERASRAQRAEAVSRPRQRSPGHRASGRDTTRGRMSRLGAERQLLLVLLRARGWLDRALERIGPEEFHDPVYRAIFEALVADPELRAPPEGLSPEAARMLEGLLGDPEDVEHTEQAFADTLATLQDRPLQARQTALERDLRSADSEDEKRRLLEELGQLRRERKGRWNVVRREGPVGIGEDDQRVNG
ncbi:MAG: DNA primase [Gemmatimonadota bacterium]